MRKLWGKFLCGLGLHKYQRLNYVDECERCGWYVFWRWY